jgi:DNA-binding GntR family transcriptional regulator
MSLSDQAYEWIRRDILSCLLLPGQQIIQQQLVEKYGVGTTPVREALQRLTHEGLVVTVPRSGYMVSTITLADVRELFEYRTILETASVRMAVIRATEQQLNQLAEKANFTYIYSKHEDYPRFVALNNAFHCSIAALTGNRRLEESLARTLDSLTRVFHLVMELRDNAEDIRAEHGRLVAALQSRDANQAVSAVTAQINRTAQLVAEALTRNLTSGPGSDTASDPGQGIHMMITGENER